MYKLFIACIFSLSLVQQDRSMTWSDDLQLQWTDFSGKPTDGTTVVAVTASGLSFGFSTKMTETQLVDYTAFVDAHFYPDKSWYIKEKANQIILDHERLHFDITELHARKFKKRIAQTKFDLRISDQMERIHYVINDELRQMQQKYDNETNHSQNVEKQKEWQQFIKLQLDKLSYYK
ncbi:MAG: DUF922 domain-containing protein [Flavobacteriaceae bacterium]|nr:DUF922 domain-containing protein [Flavobacteriaceae bacterium]